MAVKLALVLANRLLEDEEDDPKAFLRAAVRAPGLVRAGPDVTRADAIESNVQLRKFFRGKGRERWAEQFEWTLKEVVRAWGGGATYRFTYWPRGGESSQAGDYMRGREVRKYRTPKAALAYWLPDVEKFGDQYAYRGMSMQEWVQARAQGFIKSHGKGNFGRGLYPSRESYTSFSTNWGTAHSYASHFTNYYDNPTRRMPGVIVAVAREATRSAREMNVGDASERAAEQVPIDQVAGVWILTPVESGQGFFDIIRTSDGRLSDGSRAAPSVGYAVVPKSGIALLNK